MSQTLTKPILLDETGQAIAGKLDTNSAAIVEALEDIKDAVSMGTDFVPVMIKVTTPPAKVSYMAGENLNLAGIVVSLIASNGVQVDITEQCTFLPANGTPLTASDTSVAISYYWYKDDVTFTTSYPIGVKSLSSIAITTPPTITEYMVGDELDLTGIVVTATYDDGTFLDVTQNCTFNPADGTVLTASNTSVTVTYTEGTITKTASQSITVIPVYGVEWDGSSSSAFTRTDAAANFTDPVPQMSNGSGGWTEGSSPFDAILPWAGMEVVTDGTLGKLVKIPKFYYSLDCSNGVKLKISSMRFEGSFVSPAHMDRGDGVGERDYVYVGAYHCSTLYKSTTGATIKNQTGLSNFNSSIHNLSVDAWLWDYATLTTIRMLYLVEFADWNSQAKIGYGCAPVMGTIGYTGATDSMTYHTGTTATALTNYGHVKYRHIEDLWAGVQDYVNGIHTIGNDVYARILPTLYFICS